MHVNLKSFSFLQCFYIRLWVVYFTVIQSFRGNNKLRTFQPKTCKTKTKTKQKTNLRTATPNPQSHERNKKLVGSSNKTIWQTSIQ